MRPDGDRYKSSLSLTSESAFLHVRPDIYSSSCPCCLTLLGRGGSGRASGAFATIKGGIGGGPGGVGGQGEGRRMEGKVWLPGQSGKGRQSQVSNLSGTSSAQMRELEACRIPSNTPTREQVAVMLANLVRMCHVCIYVRVYVGMCECASGRHARKPGMYV